MRFITDYFIINNKLVIKAYTLPIIDDKMQKLGGFQYATTLDLNMEYYNIRLLPEIQDMLKVVT